MIVIVSLSSIVLSWRVQVIALLFGGQYSCNFIRLETGFSRIFNLLNGAFWWCLPAWLSLRRKWTGLDEIWSTLEYIVGAGLAEFWYDTRSTDSWRARRNCVLAWFHRFYVDQISRNLNTTRRSVSRWKLSEHNFSGLYTPYKKPPQIVCDVRRVLTTRQITLRTLIRRQPIIINYWVTWH